MHILMATYIDFSLRHLIYSINKLPADAKISLDVVISQPAGPHLLRTIAALALLLPDQEHLDVTDAYKYAEATIHMLYSTRVDSLFPALVYRRLSKTILSCGTAALQARGGPLPLRSTGSLHGKTWSFSMRMSPNEFDYFHERIAGQNIPTPEHCSLSRIYDVRNQTEGYKNAESRMTPNRFAGLCKWRMDGMLLPYGAERPHLNLANPSVLIYAPNARCSSLT